MSSAQQREPLVGPSTPTGESLVGSTLSNSEPLVGSTPSNSEPPHSSTDRPDGPAGKDLAAWLSVSLAVAVTLATAPLIWTPIRLQSYLSLVHADWYLYVLGAQLVAMPLLLVLAGWPRSRRGWCLFALANVELAGLAYLSAKDLLRLAAIHGLVLGLRLFIVSLWLFVLVGIPVVVWHVSTRRRTPATRVSTLGKLWFSALVFLLLAEPSAALLARVLDNPDRLALPANLPLPPPNELHVAFVGESTMAGFPYIKFGIPKVVGWQLEQMYPKRKIVLDDLSAVGLNLAHGPQAAQHADRAAPVVTALQRAQRVLLRRRRVGDRSRHPVGAI